MTFFSHFGHLKNFTRFLDTNTCEKPSAPFPPRSAFIFHIFEEKIDKHFWIGFDLILNCQQLKKYISKLFPEYLPSFHLFCNII